MRFASFVGVVSLCLGCAQIGPERQRPPPAPRRVEPTLTPSTEPSAGAPANGRARVVLDADGEQARVSRVLPRIDPTRPEWEGEEMLCISTPCAVDLQHGAHTLVFTSTANAMRSTATQVTVPSNASTTIVRHAIGREGWVNPSYVGGAALLVLGTGLSAIGGIVTGLGAFGQPARQEDGTMSNPEAQLLPGLITLGVGLLLTGGGVVVMSKNRPVQQHGATTTWTKAQ